MLSALSVACFVAVVELSSDSTELLSLDFVVFLPFFYFWCLTSLETVASAPVGFRSSTLLSGLSLFVEFFVVDTLSFGFESVLVNTLLS